MKAARILDPGPIEHVEIGDTPTPEPSPGQLLVRVRYAAVNPVDIKMAEGLLPAEQFPLTPGRDFVGTVEVLGEGTEGFAEGDRVFGSALWGPAGSFAEFVVTQPDHIALAPAEVPDELAAALPSVAFTAHEALFLQGGLQSGERVLIAGASGGVGGLAVQLAKRAGAHVIAVASSKNREYVTSLGADEFLAYDEDPEYAGAKDVDLAFDAVGGETTVKAGRGLKPGGRMISIANFALPELPSGIPVKTFSASPHPDELVEIARAAAAGEIEVPIEDEFPLANTRDALERSATGRTVGKLLIRVA